MSGHYNLRRRAPRVAPPVRRRAQRPAAAPTRRQLEASMRRKTNEIRDVRDEIRAMEKNLERYEESIRTQLDRAGQVRPGQRLVRQKTLQLMEQTSERLRRRARRMATLREQLEALTVQHMNTA